MILEIITNNDYFACEVSYFTYDDKTRTVEYIPLGSGEYTDYVLNDDDVAEIKMNDKVVRRISKVKNTNADLTYLLDDNYTLEDKAAIYIEECHISGDTMIDMDHSLDDMPKEKIGAMYVHDLMAGFVEALEKVNK